MDKLTHIGLDVHKDTISVRDLIRVREEVKRERRIAPQRIVGVRERLP